MSGAMDTRLVPYRCGSVLVTALGLYYLLVVAVALSVTLGMRMLVFDGGDSFFESVGVWLNLGAWVVAGLLLIGGRGRILRRLGLRADASEAAREDMWTLALGFLALWNAVPTAVQLFQLLPVWVDEIEHEWLLEWVSVGFLLVNLLLFTQARAIARWRLPTR